jgi:hypothetical protein
MRRSPTYRYTITNAHCNACVTTGEPVAGIAA